MERHVSTRFEKYWTESGRGGGRCGEERSSVIPVTLDDMTSTGLRADEETDRAMWRRKIISYTGDPT